MKKHISLLLAVLMIMTMLPISVAASGTLAAPTVKDSNGTVLATDGSAAISLVEGELTLAFAEGTVIDNSKLGGIAIEGIAPAVFKGALVATASANTIKLKFGRLDAGNYTLTVPATVGTEADTLAEEFTFNFSAEDKYLTKVDFSEERYTGEGATVTNGTDNLRYINAWGGVYASSDAAGAEIITETDSTNKYMQITTKANAASGIYLDPTYTIPGYNFNAKSNVDADKIIIIDADLAGKPVGGNAYIGGKMITSGAGISPGVLGGGNADIFKTAVAALNSANGCIYATPSGAGGGAAALGSQLTKVGDWYKTRLVLRREASGDNSGKLATDLYNYVTNSYEFIITDDAYIPENVAVNQIGIIGSYINTGSVLKYDYIYARPERLLSVLSVDSYEGDVDEGSVTINMSDDMLDGGLSGITIKRGDITIENVDAEKTADGRGITFTFEGGLPAGDYSVNLADLKSSNGLSIYSEGATATFTVDSANANVSPYTAAVSVPSGTISTVEGEITLEFGVNIAPATISNITFKKADGTEIAGKYFVSVNGKIITVRFGDLVDGQNYVLTLPNSVTDTEGNPVNAETYTYIAEKQALTDTDFSEYEAGAVTNGTDNIYYTNSWSNTAAESITAVKDGDDTYVDLAIKGSGGEGISVIGPSGFKFNDHIAKDKVYVVEADITSSSNLDGNWGGSKFRSTGGTGGTWQNLRSASLYGVLTGTKGVAVLEATNVNTRTFEEVLNGVWFRPTMVMRRGADDKIYSDLYYRKSGVAEYKGTDKDVASHEFDSVSLVGGNYTQTGNLKITYAAVYPTRLLSIIGDDGYTNATKSITLYTTKEVKAGTEDAVVIKKDGITIAVSDISIGADNRSIIVKFSDAGLAEGRYDIDMSNVLDANGIKAYDTVYSFEVSESEAVKVMGDPVVKDAAGNTLENGTEANPAEISVADGKLSLGFGGVITNPEKITFTKADGSAITGKYIVRTSGDVNVSFGHLEKDAVYKVTVPTAVKDTDDRSLAAEFVFYVKATEKYTTKVDFNEDEGYTVGGALTQGQDNLQYMSGWAESLDGVTIKEDNGEKYVSVQNASSGANGVLLKADTSLTNGFYDKGIVNENQAFVVEAKIRANDIEGKDRYFGMSTAATAEGVPQTPGTFDHALMYYRGTYAYAQGITPTSTLVLDANKWINPMLVIRQYTGDADKIERELYDGGNNYVYKGKYEKKGEGSTTYSRDDKNQRICLNYWLNAANTVNDLAYVYARPETLIGVLYGDEYAPGEEMKLYMTDDVDAGSLKDLKITSGGIEILNATATVDENDPRTISITAPDGLVAGEYSVDVSAVVSSRTHLRGSHVPYTFTVSEEDGTDILSLLNVSAATGDLDVDTEKIELTFTAALAADAVDGVDFTKADGSLIKGILDKKVEGNKLILTFGRLENKVDYKLEIKENAVKSADGKYTARANTIDYKGFEKYEVYQDFTNATLPEGAQPYGSDTATNWGGENIKVEISGLAEIKTDEAGDSYLEVGRADNGRYGLYLRPLSKTTFNNIFLTDTNDGKVLAVDVKLREARLNNDSKTTFGEPILDIFNTGYSIQYPIWEPLVLGGTTSISVYTKDNKMEGYAEGQTYTMEKEEGTGYTHTTAILKAEEVTYEVTNAENPEETEEKTIISADLSIFDAVAGKNIGNVIRAKDHYSYGSLDWIRVGRYYDLPSLNSGVANNRLQITEFSVIHANAMDILKSYEYNSASHTISVAMSDDVAKESLDNIKVTKVGAAEGTPAVITDASYDEATRTVTVSFPYGLEEGEYTLDVNGLSSARGFNDGKMETISFAVGAGETYITTPVFKSGDKTIVSVVKDAENEILIKDATSISVSAKIGNTPETIVVYLGVFDAGNNLVKVEKATIADGVITATANGITAGTASSARLFIWEDFENIRPLFAPVCL